MNRVLVDTNVILYTYDYRDPIRKTRSEEILRTLDKNGEGVLSVQTLSEFMNVVTRGSNPIIEQSDLLIQLQYWIDLFPVLPLTSNIVLEATRCVADHKFSFYDAQIWALAKLNQIPILFSEDFQDGQTLEGIHFVNPFTDHFKLEQWI